MLSSCLLVPSLVTGLALAASSDAPAATSALAPRVPLPRMELHAVELPDRPAMGHMLRFKLRDEVRGRATPTGDVRSEAGADLSALQAVLDELDLTVRPTIGLDPQRVLDLQARAEARTGQQAADLLGMLTVDGLADGAAMVRAGHRLQALDVVEYAYVSVVGAPPPGDIGTTTSDYSSRQGYLDADPGIDAWSAWELDLVGSHVRVSDVEYGWIDEHEDLVDVDIELEAGETVPAFVASYGWDHHGTAVLGELVAPDNGYGVTGAIHGAAAVGTYPEYTDDDGSRRPEAIASAAADSVEGDLILLEMQTVARPGGNYCPAETDPDVFTVVETAVDAGIVVVGAAGNGTEDLDGGWYVINYLAWGDSGAIIVGAGSSDTTHEPLYFSTYGERVNLQGWGEDVTTLGYGTLAYLDRDKEQTYTASFSGTSSASPIVTAAAALVQDHAIGELGAPLSPEGLRDLLIETGIPQTGSAHIGPLPDVIAAIALVDADEDGVAASEWGGADCDDLDPATYPGAEETWYDGVDSDCAEDDDYDADGDGDDSDAHGGTDCDDLDPASYPGAEDTWYDGVDSDCAGNSDYDVDGDGDDSADHGGTDCDDADPAVSGLVEESWYDGVDSDCGGDSDFDADGDGQDSAEWGGEDCDDADPETYVGADDPAGDGVDQDCDGADSVEETDGGSEDGGSEDGGSSDGGAVDGGSEDGGSSDGGAADEGSEDGGGKGCSSAPGAASALLPLLALLGLGRRRRR